MTEKERMLAGKLYCPFKVGDNTWEKSREVLEKFNVHAMASGRRRGCSFCGKYSGIWRKML